MPEKIKVLGPPGCGKTYAIQVKYQDLLCKGYNPDRITVITFRLSSAGDLQTAIQPYAIGYERLDKHVGTIHSICYRLGGYGDLMLSEDIRDFAKKYEYEPYLKNNASASMDDDESVYSGNLFDLYTWCRNTCTPLKNWDMYPGADNIELPSYMVSKFFIDYEQYKKENGKVDFSDMLQRVIDEKIRLDTPVLMVDEFQDLTAQMYKIFEMWEQYCEVVVIAGDPDQSIYGFWGGSPYYFKKWNANQEIVLQKTYRLPEQIKDFARKILISEGMEPPNPKAKDGYYDPIQWIRYDDNFPSFESELHLVRCNCQKEAVAMKLAESGSVFSDSDAKKIKKGNKSKIRSRLGWTEDEMNLANALIKLRAGRVLNASELKAAVMAYPARMSGKNVKKSDLVSSIEAKYKTELSTGIGYLKPAIIDSMTSTDPTEKMERDGKLFVAKIRGILDRSSTITEEEINKVKVMTIHGSKGLQASGVFLHTYIPGRVFEAISTSEEDAAAEARVWFVGATRAIDALYLVEDAGRRYEMPGA